MGGILESSKANGKDIYFKTVEKKSNANLYMYCCCCCPAALVWGGAGRAALSLFEKWSI